MSTISLQSIPARTDLASEGTRRRVRYAAGTRSPSRNASTGQHTTPEQERILRQHLRIQQFQQRWESIKADLPPQLTRSHIGMISIGGVIGTGLFLGSASALYHGGPVGAFLGYSIIGTVVYSLCVSIGEMIAFLPNVGGVVGLADLFVDRALGFSLGWAAWYNWSITLPTEIAAATVLIDLWNDGRVPLIALSAIFLVMATIINCFPSRYYGEFEFWLSTLKVVTIVSIIVLSLIVDLGAGKQGFIGFSKWKHPFAKNYLGVDGALGRFLGFWAVLMQACFSFFGSEVPGIAAGEVIDATRNVPRALRRVWIRITLFYVGGIFCAGLLVDSGNPDLVQNENTASSSPFVIAFKQAGIGYLSHVINAAILLSAWSAAASDIYISSRFLFFLARCHHAPEFFGYLWYWHRPSRPVQNVEPEDVDVDELDVDELHTALATARHRDSTGSQSSVAVPGGYAAYREIEECNSDDSIHISVHEVSSDDVHEGTHGNTSDVESGNLSQSGFVIPIRAVLASASVGFLSFLSSSGGGASNTFGWLSAVASIASLQSWAGMLYTYIRWYKGTVFHEERCQKVMETHVETHDDYIKAEQTRKNIDSIKANRHFGQPWLAYYAFWMCMIILFTNGWSVFLHSGWRIANLSEQATTDYSPQVSLFLSSYVPIPFFVILTLGYKIIKQTKAVEFDEMDFHTKHFQPAEEDEGPPTWRDRMFGLLAV